MRATLKVGLTATVSAVVGDSDTASALGSGDVPVLATPRVVALCEAATVAAIAGHIDSGETSVGTTVELEHRRATPVGQAIVAGARLTGIDGRRLRFEVDAADGRGPVASGIVERVVVDRERFLGRLG